MRKEFARAKALRDLLVTLPTDEELDEILRHANEEHKKRQDEKYDKESMDMFMDYSE